VKEHDVKPDLSTSDAPLAIIGIGCLFPQANDPEAYWSNITEGIDAISDIPSTHWQLADYYDRDPKSPDMTYGQRGGFIAPVSFNPMEYNIPPNILEAIDTSQLLGLVAAGQALDHRALRRHPTVHPVCTPINQTRFHTASAGQRRGYTGAS
jgi:acyl transferase domain-containing protein